MRTRSVARALVAVCALVAGVTAAAPAHAADWVTCVSTGSETARTVTVTVTDSTHRGVVLGAADGVFVVDGTQQEWEEPVQCPAWPVETIREVVVDIADGGLRIDTGKGSGYGPSADGHAYLPTKVNGTSPALTVEVHGGPGPDRISSRPNLMPGKAWSIDMDFESLSSYEFRSDVELDLGPRLVIHAGEGADEVRPSPGRPEGVFGGSDLAEPQSRDTVDFSQYPDGVYADLDWEADDGGEGDQVGGDFEVLRGGPGNDWLVGDNGRNDILGGEGDDTIAGRAGADFLWGMEGDDTLYGNDGEDIVYGGEGRNRLSGGAGIDELEGGPGSDALDGGTGDDAVFGRAGNDTILGGAAADGADHLLGGEGTDTVSYADRTTAVRIALDGQANDGARGEFDDVAEVEHAVGGAGDDVLTGDAGANRLIGGPGNDWLSGDTGADRLSGGPGTDRATYAGAPAAVTVRLDDVANDGASGEGDNVRSDVENITGTAFADTLYGSGAANRLDGGGGDDTLYARDTRRDTVLGGTGRDRARLDAVDVRSGVESLF